jgi:hypothetical protein
MSQFIQDLARQALLTKEGFYYPPWSHPWGMWGGMWSGMWPGMPMVGANPGIYGNWGAHPLVPMPPGALGLNPYMTPGGFNYVRPGWAYKQFGGQDEASIRHAWEHEKYVLKQMKNWYLSAGMPLPTILAMENEIDSYYSGLLHSTRAGKSEGTPSTGGLGTKYDTGTRNQPKDDTWKRLGKDIPPWAAGAFGLGTAAAHTALTAPEGGRGIFTSKGVGKAALAALLAAAAAYIYRSYVGANENEPKEPEIPEPISPVISIGRGQKPPEQKPGPPAQEPGPPAQKPEPPKPPQVPGAPNEPQKGPEIVVGASLRYARPKSFMDTLAQQALYGYYQKGPYQLLKKAAGPNFNPIWRQIKRSLLDTLLGAGVGGAVGYATAPFSYGPEGAIRGMEYGVPASLGWSVGHAIGKRFGLSGAIAPVLGLIGSMLMTSKFMPNKPWEEGKIPWMQQKTMEYMPHITLPWANNTNLVPNQGVPNQGVPNMGPFLGF